MLERFAAGINQCFRAAGLELRRVQRQSLFAGRRGSFAGCRLDVGCGDRPREGHIGCDVRSLPGVGLVCRAWEVSARARDLASIYSRHTLEHLTNAEVVATLNDWYESLAVGGQLEIIVPNLDHHIKQWQRVDWATANLNDPKSDAGWSHAGFYGWQRECDPQTANYNSIYWDVHKSGFNQGRMRRLLSDAGFARISTEIVDDVHLHATAVKVCDKNERQVAPTVEHIRDDHRKRYEYACRYITPGSHVADFACGVGYGSAIVAGSIADVRINAGDISAGAIEYAQQHFASENTTFRTMDLGALESREEFDVILSFETIEHVEDDADVLNRLASALRPGGTLLVSSPNEEVFPLAKASNKWHYRHYTPDQFAARIRGAGLDLVEKLTQTDRIPGDIIQGWHGIYNIAVARKNARS